MIILFDLDGTLANSGTKLNYDMIECLKYNKNRLNCDFAIVGGGRYEKIIEQLNGCTYLFKFIFSECGSVMHENNKLIYKQNIDDKINKKLWDKLFECYNDLMKQYSIKNVDQSYDKRNGLYYLSPIGFCASEEERKLFIEFDKKTNFRNVLITKLKNIVSENGNNLDVCIGGQIGIAIYPSEWNKAQVLKYLTDYKKILFIGDNAYEGGNDFPLFNHDMVEGYSVYNYHDTINVLNKL